MSKGGNSGPSTTTTKSVPLDPQKIRDWMKLLESTAAPGGKLATDPFPQQQVAPLNPNENLGLSTEVSTGQEGQGAADAALQNAQQTLNGQFLNIPTSYLDALNRQTTTEYQNTIAPSELGSAASVGAFGGSADAENRALNQFSLSRSLADANAGVYEQERQNQLAAAEKLPAIEAGAAIPGENILGAGGVQQQQSQTELNTAYANAAQKAGWPYELLNFLGQGVTGVPGGTSTTTTNNPYTANPIGAGLGGALAGGGLASMLGYNTGLGAAGGAGLGILSAFL